MKKTHQIVEEILRSGKFPAITTEERLDSTVTRILTFRLDKVNAVILERKERGSSSHVTIHMDGSENIHFEFESYIEAEEHYKYVMERW